MCRDLGISIAEEKTEWADVLVTFLGILLDGKSMTLCLPIKKKEKAIKALEQFIHKKKATIQEMQELCGYLNFLCKAIFPGRLFMRRMYAKYSQNLTGNTKLKPYHHVRLDAEFKADCKVWLNFLDDSSSLSSLVNRPMVDILAPAVTAKEIGFLSDASTAKNLGFGCILTILTILTWQNDSRLVNNQIVIHCDNMSVVYMFNGMTSGCLQCMKLIRIITLNNLKFNRRIHARWISTKDNELSDVLLRDQMGRFCRLGKNMNDRPDIMSSMIWPIGKIWY